METLFHPQLSQIIKKIQKDFDEHEKLLKEIVENLIHIFDRHFVIVTYNDFNNWIKRTISSKFKNVVETSKVKDIINENQQNKVLQKVQLKIESINNNASDEIRIKEYTPQINLENNLVRKDGWKSIKLFSRRFKQLYDIAVYTNTYTFFITHLISLPDTVITSLNITNKDLQGSQWCFGYLKTEPEDKYLSCPL